jgi:hypothetical protein
VKIETTPEIIARLRGYAEAFSAPPAIFTLFPPAGETRAAHASGDIAGASDAAPAAGRALAPVFPFTPHSDKGLGVLLLAAAVHRPAARAPSAALSATAASPGRTELPEGFGAEGAILLAALYRDYGNDLFRLNRLPFGPLQARIDVLAAHWDAEERARVPGILRSVCDFFYRVGPLSSWLEDAPDWEQRVGEIAQEIYWMGAQSPTRAPGRPHAARFSWPVSDGHMRFLFDIVKPSRASAAAIKRPASRSESFAELARTVFPQEPWRLYLPLEAFLSRDGAAGFRCRAVQAGCHLCALSSQCPAAKNFPGPPPAVSAPLAPHG